MDKRILKETLLVQAASFEADVRHKLDILANEEDFLENKENLPDQSDILLDAFQTANKEQNFSAVTQPVLQTSATQPAENNPTAGNTRHSMADKIAALRGCSLPGDYLAGTKK